MKKCIRCNISKELSNFFKRKGSADGYRSDCKHCHMSVKKDYYLLRGGAEKRRAYQKTEAYKDTKKRYRASSKGRLTERAYSKWRYHNVPGAKAYSQAYQRKWKKTDKGKAVEAVYRAKAIERGRYRVYHKVLTAFRNGTLIRKPCEVCGNSRVHAHHEDYSKPLDVKFLCSKHHTETHMKERNIS